MYVSLRHLFSADMPVNMRGTTHEAVEGDWKP